MIGIKEAAKRLSVAESTIRRWVKDGILPHYQMGGRGGRIKFEEQELDEFKQSRRAAAVTDQPAA